MNGVIYAGLGIAGATALGSVLGMLVEKLPDWVYEKICSAATGIMLYAAVAGLILPAMQSGSSLSASVALLLGAVFLEKLYTALSGYLPGVSQSPGQQRGVLLVLAIVVHHLPEGMAAGVSFGAEEAANTLTVCTGIALQNVPEAMMIFPAMHSAGAGKKGAWLAVCCSGGVELLGLVLGYGGVQLAAGLLPLLLAFAGGTMLYMVLDSLSGGDTYGVLAGFCGMMLLGK